MLKIFRNFISVDPPQSYGDQHSTKLTTTPHTTRPQTAFITSFGTLDEQLRANFKPISKLMSFLNFDVAVYLVISDQIHIFHDVTG